MELLELNPNQLLAAGGVAGFLLACLLRSLFSGSAKQDALKEDPRNHVIRELEADLRASKRLYADCQEALEEKDEEFQTAVETLQGLRARMAELEAEAEGLREADKDSIAKVRDLRLELQDRATQSIREHMRAEEAETELQVARAGTDVVQSEVSRLQEERDQLTNTMRNLEEQVVLESDSVSSFEIDQKT